VLQAAYDKIGPGDISQIQLAHDEWRESEITPARQGWSLNPPRAQSRTKKAADRPSLMAQDRLPSDLRLFFT
jgi:hypothetical protein